MRFATTTSPRTRDKILAVLPRVLMAGEEPILAMKLIHAWRGQEWLVVTRSRLLGVAKDGQVKLTVDPGTVARVDITNIAMAVSLTTTARRIVKLGSISYGPDVQDLRAGLEAVCPLLGAQMPQTVAQPPVAPAGSIADELAKLTELRNQGALTDTQFEAFVSAVLAAGHRMPPSVAVQMQSPAPVPFAPTPPKRRKRDQVKEMQRTCTRDGSVWFVPLDVAKHRPSRATSGGLKLQEFAANALLTGGSAAGVQLNRLEAQNARASAARQCPTCGSQGFTEVVVKH